MYLYSTPTINVQQSTLLAALEAQEVAIPADQTDAQPARSRKASVEIKSPDVSANRRNSGGTSLIPISTNRKKTISKKSPEAVSPVVSSKPLAAPPMKKFELPKKQDHALNPLASVRAGFHTSDDSVKSPVHRSDDQVQPTAEEV
jgi:hypothetical protein